MGNLRKFDKKIVDIMKRMKTLDKKLKTATGEEKKIMNREAVSLGKQMASAQIGRLKSKGVIK